MIVESFLPAFERESRFHPPEVYKTLRGEEPVVRTVTEGVQIVWVVLDAEIALQVLSDRRFELPPAGMAPPEMGMLFCDGAEHARLRRSLAHAFSARNLERLRPRVERVAEEHVSQLYAAGSPADLVTALARPFSLAVITEILGVPVHDREQFYLWAEAVSGLTADVVADYESAWKELIGFLGKLITAKQADPGDDLLSALIQTQDLLTEQETVMLGASLMSGGQLTTANALSVCMIKLLQVDGLRGIDGDDAVKNVVEEMLRHQTGVSGEALPRWAQTDVEVAGKSIADGEMVLVSLEATNRDPAWFEDPDRFDPGRERGRHLRFGYGPHRCVGAELARMELTAAVRSLAARIPGMTMTCAPEEIPWTGHPLDDGPAALPVTW